MEQGEAVEQQAPGATGAADELAEVMARLAAGDGAAFFTLVDRFRPPLARAVRGVARHRGARLRADEVDELVTEAALEVAALAGSWDPAVGAPPWIWARHRVAAVVDRHLGQWADGLDEDHLGGRAFAEAPVASAGHEPEAMDLLARLGRREPLVALLHEAVGRVASDRDQVVFLETALQASMGDRSPAATVAGLLGLTPEAVRQQHRRVRLRLLRLAAAEPRFAGLAGLAVVA